MEPKKTLKADLTKKTFLFFNVGLVTALLLSIFAFTLKTKDRTPKIDLDTTRINVDFVDVPITTTTPPPQQPIIEQPRIKEVKDDEPADDDLTNFDNDPTESEKASPIVIIPKIENAPEDPEQVFTFLEESAAPEGGLNAFYKFIGKKIKYPRQANRMGIEGRVYVEFIVERDGTLSNITAVSGIGGGCEEEAERVVALAPSWNPGKQRGKPVRQKIVLPINFQLK